MKKTEFVVGMDHGWGRWGNALRLCDGMGRADVVGGFVQDDTLGWRYEVRYAICGRFCFVYFILF